MDKDIDILIKKYLQAETSLEEEARLWLFFCSEEVPEEYEVYRELFRAFQEESKVRVKARKARLPLLKGKTARHVLNIVLYPSVAVVLLLCVLTLSGESDKSYARINGKKIKQQEFIEQYAGSKVQKAGLLLSGCLNPLDNLYKARRGSEIGLETLSHVKETIYNIYDNLPITIIRHEKINDSNLVPLPAGSDNERPNA